MGGAGRPTIRSGFGGLLVDALRVARLVAAGARPWERLLARVLEDAAVSLEVVAARSPLALPVERRLAFRELGLALGLHAVERLGEATAGDPLDPRLDALVGRMLAHRPLARGIEDAWLEPAAQRARSWVEHEDINAVSLATSLAPEGYLGAGSERAGKR